MSFERSGSLSDFPVLLRTGVVFLVFDFNVEKCCSVQYLTIDVVLGIQDMLIEKLQDLRFKYLFYLLSICTCMLSIGLCNCCALISVGLLKNV